MRRRTTNTSKKKDVVLLETYSSLSSNTVTFTTQTTNLGNAMTVGSVSTITINTPGLYYTRFWGRTSAVGDDIQITINSTALLNTGEGLFCYGVVNVISRLTGGSGMQYLAAGDVCRMLITAASGTPAVLSWYMCKVPT